MCCIRILDLVLRFDVVLLSIRMGVFLRSVWVIVSCWCWLLES